MSSVSNLGVLYKYILEFQYKVLSCVKDEQAIYVKLPHMIPALGEHVFVLRPDRTSWEWGR